MQGYLLVYYIKKKNSCHIPWRVYSEVIQEEVLYLYGNVSKDREFKQHQTAFFISVAYCRPLYQLFSSRMQH